MPDKFGIFSIKETLSEANKNGLKPIYVLMGNDAYLQSFFINQIANIFNESNITKQVYSFEEDDGDLILNEITGISLFSEPKLFVLRGIRKLKKTHFKDLISWSITPNPLNSIVLVKNEFDLKNGVIKELKANFNIIDVRTPFPNKIRNWMNYILKIKNINLDSKTIEILIEKCGDSIANIDNEIEKIILNSNIDAGQRVNEQTLVGNTKEYPIWKLIDSIGKKDIKLSIKYYQNLWMNNISLTQIIFNLNYLFQGILWLHLSEKNNQYGLNYFLQKNMSIYQNKYQLEEVKTIIKELRLIDFKLKSISISEKELFIPFLIKTCEGIYESV